MNRPLRSVLASLAIACLVASCAGGATPTPSPSASGSAEPARVRLALDWTPNTNHTGFYVAEANGWYAEAGIELEVLPYATVTPETLMASHEAECGISFQDSLTFAVAAGAPVRSVAAILQRTASAIAVLEDGPIERPSQLDGTTYAGFGYPNEVPTLKAVIEADGGTGEFEVATLDSAAYEALYAKRADFTIPFTAWEGIEAEQRGIGLRWFRFADYGFPEFYQVVLACDTEWLTAQPDAARRFVGATVRGFEAAAADPDASAAILVEENPGVFDANPDLPAASQRFLADEAYLLDAEGRFGTQTLERWQAYSSFLYDEGLLADTEGKPLSQPLDWSTLFTNEFLPQP